MRDSKKNLNVIFAGLAAAVIFLMTYSLKMPQIVGYIHLGDIAIVAFSLLLKPSAAFASAAIGSALADVAAGYVVYAPFTFIVKGLNALIVSLLSKKINNELSAVIGGIFMVVGYFTSEALLLPVIDRNFGLSVALSGIPGNILQAVSGIVAGSIVVRLLNKAGIKRFD